MKHPLTYSSFRLYPLKVRVVFHFYHPKSQNAFQVYHPKSKLCSHLFTVLNSKKHVRLSSLSSESSFFSPLSSEKILAFRVYHPEDKLGIYCIDFMTYYRSFLQIAWNKECCINTVKIRKKYAILPYHTSLVNLSDYW